MKKRATLLIQQASFALLVFLFASSHAYAKVIDPAGHQSTPQQAAANQQQVPQLLLAGYSRGYSAYGHRGRYYGGYKRRSYGYRYGYKRYGYKNRGYYSGRKGYRYRYGRRYGY